MGNFLEKFYDTFIASSPEVEQLFAQTDMKRQVAMLSGSLYFMTHAADESEIASGHIAQLAKHHAELGVRPDLYDLWLECLLQAVGECDPMYAPEVEEAWRCVLRKGIAAMKGSSTK